MRGPTASILVAALAAPLLFPATLAATPLDFIPVGSPLEDEIRILDVSGVPLPLPRLDTRPIEVVDLAALEERALPGPAEISRLRLQRVLARDFGWMGVPGATPRLLEARGEPDERFELSAGLEGRGTIERGRLSRFEDGSGLRFRAAAQVGRWLTYSDIAAEHVDGATRYAGRILSNDAVFLTDQSYLSYTAERQRWSALLGRGHWHWGPGDEGSLLLSKTAPSITGLALRFRIDALRADGIVLNATLRGASGMQFAAHRLEWQPREGLRLGYSEAVRYQASAWGPLYVAGVIPYSIVQNLLAKDEPDSSGAVRNNVIAAMDVAWRVAPGTRFYSELLIDDLRTTDSATLSKYAYQVGWEGVGAVHGARVSWGSELTRLTRFVYTSFDDRAFVTSGEPLGFPTGPDSRRVRVRGACDPTVSWQLFAIASRTDRGESGLDSVYTPGSGHVDVARFAGVVERTRQLELGVRYWPASGVDVALSGGWTWIENQNHVEGTDRREPYAALTVRLTR